MKAAHDWIIHRHRGLARAPGASRAVAVGLVVVGLLAAALTVIGLVGLRPVSTLTAVRGDWREPAAPVPAAALSTPGPFALAEGVPSGRPTELRILKIAVDTKLESLSLDIHGSLIPPSFKDAGWYSAGTAPGDVGPAVIAGHIDSRSGPSVFYRLHELRSGDKVSVLRGGKWINFTVVATNRYPKSAFPTAAVYGPTPTPQLRLITCGGSFDVSKGSYVDNVVVYAVVDS